MKNINTILVLIATIIFSLIAGCEEKTESTQESSLTSFDGCKYTKSVALVDSFPNDETCIQYFMEGNTLIFKHINAGFNCTPDNILAEISISNNLIVIEENQELSMPSDCKCLYDLEMQITNVDIDAYTVKVFEAYPAAPDDLIEFDLNLSLNTTGTYCLERDTPPWVE
ncbi:MAG: hypothetical protein HN894_08415 [Bacteroidetes bacterium]|jgi:hypothetical protein|nr:hypothetical protein [Bacteroidota bacterium]